MSYAAKRYLEYQVQLLEPDMKCERTARAGGHYGDHAQSYVDFMSRTRQEMGVKKFDKWMADNKFFEDETETERYAREDAWLAEFGIT